MSALKVFISSTCYDLTYVRESLRKFILSLGHEPIMSDYSDILYDPRNHTHTNCVDAVNNCDMLVFIIGGRYGGNAVIEAESLIDFETIKKETRIESLTRNDKHSITQVEVLKAIQRGVPIYTFVKQDVYSDHHLYEKNKNNPYLDQIVFPSIEKKETAKYIFEFINVVRLRNHGNNLFPFNTEGEIEETLKKQWSSYFQKLLKEQYNTSERKENSALEQKVDELEKLIWKFINETPRDRRLLPESKQICKRILWVDDYPINNETVIKFFEGQDIEFDIALSTEQGLELYKRNLYDVIITDMGRGSERDAGLIFIKKLKLLHCQVPIVVYCSWQAIQTYGDQATKLGAYSVVNGIANITSLITDMCGLNK